MVTRQEWKQIILRHFHLKTVKAYIEDKVDRRVYGFTVITPKGLFYFSVPLSRDLNDDFVRHFLKNEIANIWLDYQLRNYHPVCEGYDRVCDGAMRGECQCLPKEDFIYEE